MRVNGHHVRVSALLLLSATISFPCDVDVSAPAAGLSLYLEARETVALHATCVCKHVNQHRMCSHFEKHVCVCVHVRMMQCTCG